MGTRSLLIALVGLASLLPAPAAAQSTAARPVENFEAAMNQVIRITTPAMSAMIDAQLKRPLTAAEERGLVAAFQRSFRQVYPRTLFEEETAAALTRHLTDEELGELLRFYESPVGAKMLGLRPLLMAESERVFKVRQQQFSEHLRGELAREFPR